MDIRPFIAALIVSTVYKAGEPLYVPIGMDVREMSSVAFENMIHKQAGVQYDQYGTIGKQLLGREPANDAEVERAMRARMES